MRKPILQVRIRTRNRAKNDDLQSLQKLSVRLQEATDVMAFYVSVIKEAPSARGGLGIGRVAAEAEMKVSMQFEEQMVVVCAELEGA